MPIRQTSDDCELLWATLEGGKMCITSVGTGNYTHTAINTIGKLKFTCDTISSIFRRGFCNSVLKHTNWRAANRKQSLVNIKLTIGQTST